MPVLILTLSDVQKALTIKDCIRAVERAFKLYAEGRATVPPNRIFHQFRNDLAWIYAVAGAILDDNLMVLKALPVNWDNPWRYNIPHMYGVILLCEATTGVPLSVMDATYITNVRTGAVAGLGAKYLARNGSQDVAVIGSRDMARYSLIAIKEIIPSIKHVRVFSKTKKNRELFAEELKGAIDLEIKAVEEPSAAVKDADIIITATSAKEPTVLDSQVFQGTFLAAIGSKYEVDPRILGRAKVVAEIAEECKTHGKLGQALQGGFMKEEDLYAQLEDLVVGRKRGRSSDDEITLLDSIGLAIEDVAAAGVAYTNAKKMGLGVEVDLYGGLRAW
jgi:alanine dehydrogenase